MEKEHIVDRIKKVLVTDLFVDMEESEIGITDGLQSVIGLDSLGFVELRMQCENIFQIHISNEDFTPENFRNIECVANMVQKLLPK